MQNEIRLGKKSVSVAQWSLNDFGKRESHEFVLIDIYEQRHLLILTNEVMSFSVHMS